MLLTEEVEIKLNANNIKYYKQLNYVIPMKKAKNIRNGREYVFDLGKSIMVKTSDLPRYSKAPVEVKCDYCGNVKIIPYCLYLKSIASDNNKYACSDCRVIKSKEITQLKYGVDSVSKLLSVKKRKQKRIIKILLKNHHLNKGIYVIYIVEALIIQSNIIVQIFIFLIAI